MGTVPSAASPATLPNPSLLPAKPSEVRREEEEQEPRFSPPGREQSGWTLRRRAPWAKSLAARRRRETPCEKEPKRPDEGIGPPKSVLLLPPHPSASPCHLPPGRLFWGAHPAPSGPPLPQGEGLGGRPHGAVPAAETDLLERNGGIASPPLFPLFNFQLLC